MILLEKRMLNLLIVAKNSPPNEKKDVSHAHYFCYLIKIGKAHNQKYTIMVGGCIIIIINEPYIINMRLAIQINYYNPR